VIATIFSSAWWVPPCCGTAAGECTCFCKTGRDSSVGHYHFSASD
jgi:hypothetical protein